jgi:hypothetical protein
MSSFLADRAVAHPLAVRRLNPAELKIELLCRGMLIDGSCRIAEEGRPISIRPEDPASGLELILPGEISDLWVNVPVNEKFVVGTPYHLRRAQGEYRLLDTRHGLTYEVRLAPSPAWYNLRTARGIPMSEIGMMQGTILPIDIWQPVRFDAGGRTVPAPPCATGGQTSAGMETKSVRDVVETAAMAQKKSGITLALLRGGYQGAGGLSRVFPYLEALKQEVGILVGMQFPPEADLELYDQARSLGVDHISFTFENCNREGFDRIAAGKHGRESLCKALEHCARGMGKGRVSGEIVAGIEPLEDTLRAIDYIAGVGALPLVGVFRPLRGTPAENHAPPGFSTVIGVFRHVYQACRSNNLPLGMAPNIRLSVLPHPEDTLYLASDSQDVRSYQSWIFSVKQVMRPYFLRRMRKQAAPKT